MNPNVSGVSEHSPLNSPCKPLNVEGKSRDLKEKKDFNSSSDTYVSDKEEQSPSKSIMKKKPKTSVEAPQEDPHNPENHPQKVAQNKKVGFQPEMDTVHAYTQETDEHETEEDSRLESEFPSHQWNELEYTSQVESPAPVPPPHSVDTITGLLQEQDSDASIGSFSGEKTEITGLSGEKMVFGDKMTLNDKLNVYLNSKNTNDDLDQHLDKLGRATDQETDVNIMALSHRLEPHVTPIQNPLSALSNTQDIYLNSAHSSQSSLQSLLDSNRQLEADAVAHSSKGFEVRDGIKGFSDDMASHIFSYTNETGSLSSLEEGSFGGESGPERGIFGGSDERDNSGAGTNTSGISATEATGSHSETYQQAEKSIMNYLNGSLPAIQKPHLESVQSLVEEPEFGVKQELLQPIKMEPGTGTDSETSGLNDVKQEFKKEFSGIHEETFVKSEPMTFKAESDMQSEVEPEADSSSSSSEYGVLDTKHHETEAIPKAGETQEPETLPKAEETQDTETVPKVEETQGSENFSSAEAIQKPTVGQDEAQEACDRISSQKGFEANFENSDSGSSENFADSQDFESHTLAPIIREKVPDFDSSVLANSSNIQPPQNMRLPSLDLHDSSFADFNRNINTDSYEESLSAEHDPVKNNLDFLSIWRSQHLRDRNNKNKVETPREVPKVALSYNSEHTKNYMPISLRNRKFKDVNLISTKVVNKTYEDLNISGFLPEISQDSNFEGHFNTFLKVSDSTFFDRESTLTRLSSLKSRRHSLGSSNVLNESRWKAQPTWTEKQPKRVFKLDTNNEKNLSSNERYNERIHDYKSRNQEGKNSDKKRSKFYVPSFEIKRSNSVLSPKNQYNDIFNDCLEQPTISAKGMKTLPSMDKDDIKRIMKMKRTMTQDEYSRLKNVGGSTVSAAHKSTDKIGTLSRKASISDTIGSEMTELEKGSHTGGEVADLAKPELPEPNLDMETPVRRLSSNNPFRSGGFDGRKEKEIKNESRKENPMGQSESGTPRSGSPVTLETPMKRPKEVKSPIKLRSPVRVVHKNGSVTGVFLDKPSSVDLRQFQETEVDNSKSSRGFGEGGKIPKEPETGETEKDALDLAPIVNTDVVPQPELNLPKVRDHKNGMSTVTVQSNSDQAKDVNRAVYQSIAKGTVKKVNLEEEKRKVAEASKEEEKGSEEKGKLFFRVLDVTDIQVPELNRRKAKFNLTLDNGVHCIKTPDYNMNDKRVGINKEFELLASGESSIQFILTMKASYEKSTGGYREVNERKVVRAKTRLGRLFGSKEVITTSKFVPNEVKDVYDNIFATDGSFARCYIDLDSYREQITGKAQSFRIQCYNEWGNGGKMTPYPICTLEAKMLYIPKLKEYEVLPRSIKAAYENLQDLKHEKHLLVEGFLHQEGGDCETWKKRWFRLEGTSLVAHSEFTKKTRAKINLEKVVEVIFVDRENMTKSSGNYRNFSDIFLMENMFKIKFANGEIIDFGASSKSDKNMWISAVQEIVYRNKFRRLSWVKLMQEKN